MTKKLFLFGLLLASWQASFADAVCNPRTAAHVEQKVSEIDDWGSFFTFYRKFSACDRSALRLAFTSTVARLAGEDDGMVSLHTALKSQPKLQAVILRHLRSEAISTDEQTKILKNLQNCAEQQKPLCKSVLVAIS